MIDRVSVAFVPVYQNPYQHLLTNALQGQDIDVIHLKSMPTYAWLLQQRRKVHVIHLHWLSGLYMHRFCTPLQLGNFLVKILLAKKLGYKIIWTVHNILPHKLPFPPMHYLVRRFIMHQADEVISHCEFGRKEITRLFPRNKSVHVIPIGNYNNVYTTTVDREQARNFLNIPAQSFVYLFLGNIEQYKGIETFVDTFRLSAGEADIALIAGRNRAPKLVISLHAMTQIDSRIRIHARFIPDEEIQYFLRSANVMVLPFREILTSSSVITGMSYEIPIIAPSLGCLPELITPEAGILYNNQDPTSLLQAMQLIKTLDTDKMGKAAKAITDRLSWMTIAQQTAKIYRQCIRNG